IRAFGTERLMRSNACVSLLEKRHPRFPHWYLLLLGVDPPAQGQGVGKALVRPILERCDREGLPAYLETGKERNVRFYASLGFDVMEEIALPGGGPKIWLLLRNPSPSA